MIPIEQQVTCLELSKQLKAAGYPQDGLLYWEDNGVVKPYITPYKNANLSYGSKYWCAPTVAELGEKLRRFNILYGFRDNLAWVNYDTGVRWSECDSGKKICTADTEADARCKMWLYLKEKGLL